MRESDILIVARPDHSIQIYNSLNKQNLLRFTYLTFKVVPHWIKHLMFNWNRLQAVGDNAHISLKCTVVDLLRYKFHIRFAQKLTEENIMGKEVKAILKNNHYRIVHYWPLYAYDEIERWASENPDSLVIADVHFPNPRIVISEMLPVYEKYGLSFSETVWPRHLDHTKRILENAPSFMVPSEYVASSYKVDYPEKVFYVVTYGISVSPKYNYAKRVRKKISTFVFAGGTISLEKGCDLLCEFFSKHSELTLHLYGVCAKDQEFIFSKYKQYHNIFFHGHVPKGELQDRIITYDVGIHLSRFDAYSLSVGEILGCGLPVVVSNKTGIAMEVEKNGWGIVTELDDNDISDAIGRICKNETYDKCRENIDSYIRSSHKSYGDKMIDFYSKFC